MTQNTLVGWSGDVISLKEFAEKAYLDYSMYVVLDRALPHIADGLKPVQRRIIYAMSELGLRAPSKPMKSARTVGDVIGKFHPHGDSACYEAMALMAQSFSFRYPLVLGQGNWGSPDNPKSFAAMRYTEASLTPFAEVLLRELRLGTVDWHETYDGRHREPRVLPATLPHVLLNGAAGIAVGMATDVPPHNVREVAAACIALLDNPKTSLDELCQIVRGPDFPTAAEIVTPAEEIRAFYERGTGSVRMRARYEIEDGDIVISALPFQVSGDRVLEQINQQMDAKKLPMVEDWRDESDHEQPTRLVIIPKSRRVDHEELMLHLFATTDLEKSYRVNMNVVGLNNKPQVKNLKSLLVEWLSFREQTVRRRLEHLLQQVLDRLHILSGLLIAHLNIDEVIAIIRENDEPKPVLMQRFELSDIQAEAILNIRLRNLAKLEEMKLRSEQSELEKERERLEKILGSRRRLLSLIKKEIEADAEKFGDERRSPIVERAAAEALDTTKLAPVELVTVVLSARGWVKAAKGHEIEAEQLNYRSGDEFRSQARGRSNQVAIFLDSTGRSYCIAAHTLPSARGQGEPLSGRLNPPDGATFEAVIMGETDATLLLSTAAGYGFLTTIGDLVTKNRAGKSVLNVGAQNMVLAPRFVTDPQDCQVALVSSAGYLLIHDVRELPILPRGKGVKMMGIPAQALRSGDEKVVGVEVLAPGCGVTIFAGKRHITLRPSDLEHYVSARAKRGRKLPRGFQRVDRIVVAD